MNGYGGSIAVWCYVLGARNFVELFACSDVAFRNSEVTHSLKKDSVVHVSEGAFEVGVGRVYVFFLHFGVLVYHDVCREAMVYLSMSSKAIRCVA
jgi:hypothetical protein